jgi:hypothetical protein
MATDLYTHPDYYNMDDLYTEEQLLVRDAARAWVKKEVSPIIDEHYEKATFPNKLPLQTLAPGFVQPEKFLVEVLGFGCFLLLFTVKCTLDFETVSSIFRQKFHHFITQILKLGILSEPMPFLLVVTNGK